MPRVPQGALSPWIEDLIQSYGNEEGNSKGGRLKAYVGSVGHMTQSQSRKPEGFTELIFLSDGVVQIPTILTSTAWEHLQELEERECFTSLLNTTVCIRDYQLQFHIAEEPSRCRFFLSVGEMVSIAVGPTKYNTPCCSTLPSVQQKICNTWKSTLVQETQDSQMRHNDFNLSDLLHEWQLDSLQPVLDDVGQTLMMVRSTNLNVFTSTSILSATQMNRFTPTSWDIERVRDSNTECFSIPIKCLLIPEGHAMQGQKENEAILKTDGDTELNLWLSESLQSSSVSTDWQTRNLPEGERVVQNSGANITHHDNVCVELTNKDITPLEKPWDMFPPPNGFSFSSVSPEAIPKQSMQSHQQNSQTNLIDTQLLITSTREVLQHSKDDHSLFPPYQKPPLSSGSNDTATPNSHIAPEDKQTMIENVDVRQEVVLTQHRKSKRKRDVESVQDAQTTVAFGENEDPLTGSPPSWLFDSVMPSGIVEGSVRHQTLGAEKRKTLTAHADGAPFSYTYMVSGQNLQDLRKFHVAKALLPWAIKYLVSKQRLM